MGVYDDVQAERARQDEEWGGPEHDAAHPITAWWSFIDKQMHLLWYDIYRNGIEGWNRDEVHIVRDRMVKVAALAVAAIEAIDRTLAPK
jgi:hypothetical protein